MKKDVNVESDGSELAIWGTQKKTEIGGMTVIGRKDQFGGPVAYVADRPDFIVKAVNCHDELVAALEAALAWANNPNAELERFIHISELENILENARG